MNAHLPLILSSLLSRWLLTQPLEVRISAM